MSDVVGLVTVVGIFVVYEYRLTLLVIQHRNITKTQKLLHSLEGLQ